MAEDGQVAVDLYRKSMEKTCCNVRYKAILSDIQMPVMDGITCAKTIIALEHHYIQNKKITEQEKVLLVAISAYSDKEKRDEAIQAGFYRYLTKPVNADILTRLVNSALDSDN